MMDTLNRIRQAVPPEVIEAVDHVQLVALRWIVKFNRATANAFRWASPMAAYWWMPAAGLGVGVVAGVASRMAG